MSWYKQIYPVIACDLSSQLHLDQYGPPPAGYEYVCYPLPFQPGQPEVGSIVYAQVMANIYRMSVNWSLGEPETNMAVTTHDWLFTPDGDPSEAQWAVPEGRMDTFLGAISDRISSLCHVVSYRWHELAGDGTGAETNQIRFTERNLPFNGHGLQAPQVSCSITEITDVRRRWGRFYLPFPTTNIFYDGRLAPGLAAILATPAAALLSQADPEWQAIVYGKVQPTTLPIRKVRVDDVPDIIRSRRWSGPSERATVDVPTT